MNSHDLKKWEGREEIFETLDQNNMKKKKDKITLLSEIKLMDQKHFIIFLSHKQPTLEFGDANSGFDLEAEEDADR